MIFTSVLISVYLSNKQGASVRQNILKGAP